MGACYSTGAATNDDDRQKQRWAPQTSMATTNDDLPPSEVIYDDALCHRVLTLMLEKSARHPVDLPKLEHHQRIPSGGRGVSLRFLRGFLAFVMRTDAAASSREMKYVCKGPPEDVSVCQLTACTGLSLAESVIVICEEHGIDSSVLVGKAEIFFSYSWEGTKLSDVVNAIGRVVDRIHADEEECTRYFWIDMYCASQNLLGGKYFASEEEKMRLKGIPGQAEYLRRKEDTDSLFEDAVYKTRRIVFFCSPLIDEWKAPPHVFLSAEHEQQFGHLRSGDTPYMRRGPFSITRAWCLFELSKALLCKHQLFIELNDTDRARLKQLVLHDLDKLLTVFGSIDASAAQVSKVEDREFIETQIKKLDEGYATLTKMVRATGNATLGPPSSHVCALSGMRDWTSYAWQTTTAMREWLRDAALGVLGEEEQLHGPHTPLTLRFHLGLLFTQLAQWPRAEDLLTAQLEAQERVAGTDDPLSLKCRAALGETLMMAAQHARAEELLEVALHGQMEKAPLDPATLRTMHLLANTIKMRGGRVQKAEELYRSAIEAQGDDNVAGLESVHQLANLKMEEKQLSEAVGALSLTQPRCAAERGAVRSLPSRCAPPFRSRRSHV